MRGVMKLIILLILLSSSLFSKTYESYAKVVSILDMHVLEAYPTLAEALPDTFLEWLKKHDLQHTYFCIDGDSECYSISGYGVFQGKTHNGVEIEGTYSSITEEQHCKAWYYTNNDTSNVCSMFFYGIQGVCHQHINRGLAASGKEIKDILEAQDKIGPSARLSYAFWGVFGIDVGIYSWDICKKYVEYFCRSN